MPFTQHECKFSIGEKVILDGDTEMTCTVTGVLIRMGLQQIEINWIHNGDLKSGWVDDWRLTSAEEQL